MTEPRFALTPEQKDFAARVRALAATELKPAAAAGQPGRVNRELVKTLGSLGLLARLFPGVTEGAPSRAAAATDLCLLRESLATESTEAETALALQGLGAYPILQSGQAALVRKWLPAVAAGDAVAAFALSEPSAGSDAAALALTAAPDGDGWRLTGEKTWISNAPEADFYTVFARTTAGAGARGVSAFVVPAGRPGLAGSHLDMLSPHPIGSLVFDGVRVGRAELLGEVDGGFRVAMRTLDLFRPSVGAFAVGMATAALDASVAYAGQRVAFQRPLMDHQALSHLLADMATRVEAARLLVYSAAAAYDADHTRRLAGPAAMAKLFATETAQFVVDAAVQIHGARALQRGHLLEHLYREVRAPRIYEGTSEIQRTIIARELYRDRLRLNFGQRRPVCHAGRRGGRRQMARGIQVGDKAPDFTLPSQSGEQVSLRDRLGYRVVVLYFYPKDNTTGCTAEACAFRDSYQSFTEAGADVIGVSSDSVDRHAGFAGKHGLPFTLLSDRGGKVRKAYGVPATLGVVPGRVTYVIDQSGTVRLVFNSMTSIGKHVGGALDMVRQLQAEPAS
jgi:acyl-CoA dehydrogenase